jgi:hypothetical protein
MGRFALAGLGAVALAVAGCGGGGSKATVATGHSPVAGPMTIHLSSPAGEPHHYVIELLALRLRLRISSGFASGVLARQRPVAAGVLRGTYSRG